MLNGMSHLMMTTSVAAQTLGGSEVTLCRWDARLPGSDG